MMNKRPYTIPATKRGRGAPLEHMIAFGAPTASGEGVISSPVSTWLR
jgi:hypothetical protein